ncbi:SHOCT domain-containing protein [Chengkuizengella sediminis]|uniref:SHOCT domain-containing protein n=1 Tax=Chengkuizengella sediminis TaxID=1885917 RepID=UPI0013895D2F|nr:SHOCT domain-containing protein [Chengkuizengella sediminis]NDI35250.1 SHOCT domain-containing protein [Chengkuizengella sediminis]
MHWFDECAGFQGGGIMMLGMFLFWGALVFLGFYLLKKYINGNRGSTHHIDILKERLARGEITVEEYDRLKEKL